MVSLQENLARLQGVWNLESFVLCTADDLKPIIEPLGENPLGKIMFLHEQYMSCTLTSLESTKRICSAQWTEAPNDEIASVARTMTTYCGQFQLFEQNGELTLATKVDIALDPTWMNSTQVRKVTFDQDKDKTYMTLIPLQALILPNGMKTTGVLKWSRAEPRKVDANL